MTRITVARKDGIIVGIKSEGHSGYAPAGSDIVCAAVSALMQALLVGIQDVEGLACELREKKAFFEVSWSLETAVQVRQISETIAASLAGVAAAYPDNIKIVEV